MTKLPTVSGKKLLQKLKKNGYEEVRRKGSHVFVREKRGTKGTVVPVHANEDLGKGLLRSILQDLDLNLDRLEQLLKS